MGLILALIGLVQAVMGLDGALADLILALIGLVQAMMGLHGP
jgi:hypothetical protein